MVQVDKDIAQLFSKLYILLLDEVNKGTIEAEECLGLIAEAQAIYLGEDN